MPRAEQAIMIHGDPDAIFAITNDIERWPVLFVEYRQARVLQHTRHGRFAKLVFELSNAEGETWQSWRLLDYEERLAIAQRGTPLFPFRYMHLIWQYEPVPGGVIMRWIQDFEMDPQAPLSNEQALARTQDHMAHNQAHFKEVLEGQGTLAIRTDSGDRER
jgi:aromatase